MIRLHPSPKQLEDFVRGDLEPTMALVVSAHVDMCACCRKYVEQLDEQVSEEAFNQSVDLNDEFAHMLAQITQLPAADVSDIPNIENKHLELDGRQFALPRALRNVADKIGNWSHMPGKLWQAPVDLGAQGKAHFIYMEKGGRVPEHTHKGSEITLVINGEFCDGIDNYDSGDFMIMNADHKHTPFSNDDDGCLVFTVVDKPLHFTSGVARLLNPFSHLFF